MWPWVVRRVKVTGRALSLAGGGGGVDGGGGGGANNNNKQQQQGLRQWQFRFSATSASSGLEGATTQQSIRFACPVRFFGRALAFPFHRRRRRCRRHYDVLVRAVAPVFRALCARSFGDGFAARVVGR
jgi:hypothetical protein